LALFSVRISALEGPPTRRQVHIAVGCGGSFGGVADAIPLPDVETVSAGARRALKLMGEARLRSGKSA